MGPFKEVKRKKARMTMLNSIILKGTWPSLSCPVESPEWSVCALDQGFFFFFFLGILAL